MSAPRVPGAASAAGVTGGRGPHAAGVTPAAAITRRRFLQVSGGAGAGLVLAFRLPGLGLRDALAAAPQAPPAVPKPNAWIRIAPDGSVTFLVSESEMGQGVFTSIPMILADELEADWKTVRAEAAPTDSALYGRQSTGGSTSIRRGIEELRRAGAAARQMLIAAAAAEWGVPAAECRAENGEVIHDASGRRLAYGTLADAAAALEPPAEPRLKSPEELRYIGKPMPRLDTPAKVEGSAGFGFDVKLPGLRTALVERSPTFGGKVKSFDAAPALALPGVRHVVQIPSGVAVVADGFWAALKGRRALHVEWDFGPHVALDDEAIWAVCRGLVPKATEVRLDGQPGQALEAAATKVEAEYEVPYLAHAPMEPMNCTADVRPDGCDIWVPTQAQTSTQRTAARITGLPPEKVAVHTTFLGGGFGRRSQTDFVAEAVHISKAVGEPVKLLYTREDDTRAGYYRPVAYHRLSGGVDADGRAVAWTHVIVSPSILEGFGIPLDKGVDRTAIEGAENLPYAIPNLRVAYANPDLPIPVHFWRSVGNSFNAFVTEGFIDELAAAAEADPVEFRLALLADHPRRRRALNLAAEKAGWGTDPPAGRARGAAVYASFGSIVAQVAEVSLDEGGAPRVHRVVCAVDCGRVINPDTVRAQMESGIAFGLTAALWGKITIEAGAAVEGNFNRYRILRMSEAPVVETHIIAEGDPIGGIGEVGVPPIAPAVCNALYALTGKRIRTLPIGRLT